MINKIKRGVLKPTLELAGRIETATHGAVRMQSWVEAGSAAEAVDALCPRCGEAADVGCTSQHCPNRAQAAA